ncbi:MAG: hypothetical protein FJZ00_07895 [Candidatus Sericytochromatia bacterium]|uniref:Uncharacterized protein n=1 Tax=Candidatus Tanganyikabacteria bacterium TaxID=2961651 RepID=A0A938BNF0_9BACT|nr:hypothetical protein [Candidatus Tanganyikabacteria bacterium]
MVDVDDAVLTAPVEISASGDFARVELREAGRGPDAPMVVMTNPIYFRP